MHGRDWRRLVAPNVHENWSVRRCPVELAALAYLVVLVAVIALWIGLQRFLKS